MSTEKRRVRVALLLSVSYVALTFGAGPERAHAQSTSGASTLPPVQVDEPARKPPRRALPTRRSGAATRNRQATRTPPPAPPAPIDTQEARTGSVGVYSNSTAVATKTNTPLINIPQSLNVLTKSYIKDQNFQSVTDVTRYVPGVAIHQGEGNRDELVIRGVDSSANFFVNGFRDDVQYYRDLYNTQSVEVLKGPSALSFGRGSGGGLLNRTLKEADWSQVKELVLQTGSYADRRVAIDLDHGINPNVAARLNMFYEGSDTFRQYGQLERYGINPTVTLKPNDTTKVKLSYEYYHDLRTADRGNPSQAKSAVAPAATRFDPSDPFAPNGDLTAFFGSPTLNIARSDVQTLTGVIEHDFENGLTVKNSTLYANYQKFYQNVYPGNGVLSGAVNPADTAFNLAAYNHATNRENIFNQTDFVYKTMTGAFGHTIAFGTEFGNQNGVDLRNTGFFPNGTNTTVMDPFNPTYFGPINFVHIATDSNSIYRLNIASGYARDTVEVTRWLQLIGGARYDRFDLTATDANTNTTRNRVDNLVSPQAAVIVKPMDNLSIYGVYSVSYLPASGDQFSSLNAGTLIIEPQKFENKEVGVKFNITPRLQYTAAVYELNRTNVPLADPNNPGFFILSGSNLIRGFETALNGYVTNDWQAQLGYAYTDARVTSDTSATIVAGNRVQLVPLQQISLWNKYQFNPVWSGSVGVIYFSDSFASSDDTVRLPGFVRVDAGVFAKINDNWKMQLNVENVFDQGYWASADGNNNLSPGQPRTFRLTAIATY